MIFLPIHVIGWAKCKKATKSNKTLVVRKFTFLGTIPTPEICSLKPHYNFIYSPLLSIPYKLYTKPMKKVNAQEQSGTMGL